MGYGFRSISAPQGVTAFGEFFSGNRRNPGIDDVDDRRVPARISLSAGEREDQIGLHQHREVSILLRRRITRHIDHYFVVATKQVAEAESTTSVSVDLIDYAAA